MKGLALRPGVIDSAISISVIQWLCYADKSSHDPRKRLKAFFSTLYRCLAKGAKAALQLCAENMDQHEMIMPSAMRAGFAGGMVVDWPHSSKARKAYLVITCGPVSKGKGEGGESCTDGSEDSEDEKSQTVCISDRNIGLRKKLTVNKKGKTRGWELGKKDQMRRGHEVPPDTKYTARKRKPRF